MLSLLGTAERTGDVGKINSYVLSRHVYAYILAKQYIGDLVLELGAGNGYGMRMLSNNCKSYIAVDKYLNKNISMNGNTALFKSKLPDLGRIGNNFFDTIVCFQVIEHIKDDAKLISEIYRVLKPGGNLLLTTPNINMSLSKNPYHIREYSTQSMSDVIASSFNKFDIKGVYGNSLVMHYYVQNKKNIEKIMRWDVFDLQYTLPRGLLKLPYNIMNNINRFSLFQKNQDVSTSIMHTDFYLDKVTNECLDFFVIAEKNK